MRSNRGTETTDRGPAAGSRTNNRESPYDRVRHQRSHAASRSAFVGRQSELTLFEQWFEQDGAGGGRVVTVAGEAGIGKTRLLEEVAHRARRRGLVVLRGTCEEDFAGHSFAPYRLALDGYVAEATETTLRTQLGAAAGVIAQLVPRVCERLPEVVDPERLQPDEERTRLLDAVSQFLVAIAARGSLVLIVDDLHWADDDTLALLRHLARTLASHRILIATAYRDQEVADDGSLAQTFGVLQRQPGFDRVALTGLANPEVEALLQDLAEQRSTTWSAGPVDAALTQVIGDDSKGNPFFVRSLVLHLEEEGRLRVEEGRWRASAPLEEVTLPEGVRQLLRRRISRLMQPAQAFLTVAAAVGRTFRFDVVAAVSELNEDQALAVIDAALQAQLIEPAPALDSYAFAHALVRQTLYESLDASRRERLHRRIGEAMEQVYGERGSEHAAEIAEHYHRSRTLPGAERGVPYCLVAAAQAERGAAFAEAAAQWRAALELLPANAPEALPVQTHLGLALVGALRFEEAVSVALEVAARRSEATGPAAAADHLAAVARALDGGGGGALIPALARDGLKYAGDRRDATWAELKIYDIIERENTETNGIPLDTPERREVAAVLERTEDSRREMSGGSVTTFVSHFRRLTSRAEILARDPEAACVFEVGDYRGGIQLMRDLVQRDTGRIGLRVGWWAGMSGFHVALGEFDRAREALRVAVALAERLPAPAHYAPQLGRAEDDWRLAMDDNWGAPMESIKPGWDSGWIYPWYGFTTLASIARTLAHMGRIEPAMRRLVSIEPAIERAPGWAQGYTRIACDAAGTLWLCQRTESIEIIERNLREKVVAPDFHYPMMNGHLSVARLCALQERYDEARDWFANARSVLDAQGARPLRAITDYDEALMYYRRGGAGDVERAGPLLDAALAQFRSLGMPGWTRRTEHLLRHGREWSPGKRDQEIEGARSRVGDETDTRPPEPDTQVFHRSGGMWTIMFGGMTVQLRDVRGLLYLARLLAQPGRELHATELLAAPADAAPSAQSADEMPVIAADLGDSGQVLDAKATAQYQQRLGELREALAEAEADNDIGRAAHLRDALASLVDQLANTGRDRRTTSHAERARVTVTKGIIMAMKKIAAAHPSLGRHLKATIRTGYFCSYTSDPHVEWDV